MEKPATTVFEERARTRAIEQLWADFTAFAEKVVAVLARERSLPPEWQSACGRTLRQAGVGGVAGGQKFVVGGAFFKCAADDRRLYGADAFAAKAAGHELKSLRYLLSCRTPQLHFPFCTVIDHMG